jgi:hypothetical protein
VLPGPVFCGLLVSLRDTSRFQSPGIGSVVGSDINGHSRDKVVRWWLLNDLSRADLIIIYEVKKLI